MDKSIISHLTASYYGKINCVSFSDLVEELGSAEKLLTAPKSTLLKYLTDNNASQFQAFVKTFSPQKTIEELKKLSITYVPRSSPKFPPALKPLSDCPIGLFIKGNTELLTQNKIFIVVIGSRVPSSYGKMATQSIIGGLPNNQICIVSGLALGIDGIAHKQALVSDIPTIAVLGCGVDVVYPASHHDLYDQILSNNGAIISEIPPHARPERYYFISRNRIVAGISQAVVVIEGSNRSGTLTTARFAAEYDRPVFALPHPITSRGGQAPHQLIKDGAQIITSSSDIIEFFDLKKKGAKQQHILTPNQQAVLKLIVDNPDMQIDNLCHFATFSTSELFAILSELEIKGVIAKTLLGTYHQVI